MNGLKFEETPKARRSSNTASIAQEKPARKFTNIVDVVEKLTRAAETTKYHVSNLQSDAISMKHNTENIEKRISKIENDIGDLKETNNQILDMLVQISLSLKKNENEEKDCDEVSQKKDCLARMSTDKGSDSDVSFTSN